MHSRYAVPWQQCDGVQGSALPTTYSLPHLTTLHSSTLNPLLVHSFFTLYSSFTLTTLFFHFSLHSSFTLIPLFFHSHSPLLSLLLYSSSTLTSLLTRTPLYFQFTLLSLAPLFFHSHSTLLSLALHSSFAHSTHFHSPHSSFTLTSLFLHRLYSYFTVTPFKYVSKYIVY